VQLRIVELYNSVICHVKRAETLTTVRFTVNDCPTATSKMLAGSTRITVPWSAEHGLRFNEKQSNKNTRKHE
jgi:hypothetical protein